MGARLAPRHGAARGADRACIAAKHVSHALHKGMRFRPRPSCPAQGMHVSMHVSHALHKACGSDTCCTSRCTSVMPCSGVCGSDTRPSCPAQGHARLDARKPYLRKVCGSDTCCTSRCTSVMPCPGACGSDTRSACPAQGHARLDARKPHLHKVCGSDTCCTSRCTSVMPCSGVCSSDTRLSCPAQGYHVMPREHAMPVAATDHFGPLRDHCRLEPIPITFGIARYESVYALVSHT